MSHQSPFEDDHDGEASMFHLQLETGDDEIDTTPVAQNRYRLHNRMRTTPQTSDDLDHNFKLTPDVPYTRELSGGIISSSNSSIPYSPHMSIVSNKLTMSIDESASDTPYLNSVSSASPVISIRSNFEGEALAIDDIKEPSILSTTPTLPTLTKINFSLPPLSTGDLHTEVIPYESPISPPSGISKNLKIAQQRRGAKTVPMDTLSMSLPPAAKPSSKRRAMKLPGSSHRNSEVSHSIERVRTYTKQNRANNNNSGGGGSSSVEAGQSTHHLMQPTRNSGKAIGHRLMSPRNSVQRRKRGQGGSIWRKHNQQAIQAANHRKSNPSTPSQEVRGPLVPPSARRGSSRTFKESFSMMNLSKTAPFSTAQQSFSFSGVSSVEANTDAASASSTTNTTTESSTTSDSTSSSTTTTTTKTTASLPDIHALLKRRKQPEETKFTVSQLLTLWISHPKCPLFYEPVYVTQVDIANLLVDGGGLTSTLGWLVHLIDGQSKFLTMRNCLFAVSELQADAISIERSIFQHLTSRTSTLLPYHVGRTLTAANVRMFIARCQSGADTIVHLWTLDAKKVRFQTVEGLCMAVTEIHREFTTRRAASTSQKESGKHTKSMIIAYMQSSQFCLRDEEGFATELTKTSEGSLLLDKSVEVMGAQLFVQKLKAIHDKHKSFAKMKKRVGREVIYTSSFAHYATEVELFTDILEQHEASVAEAKKRQAENRLNLHIPDDDLEENMITMMVRSSSYSIASPIAVASPLGKRNTS